VTGLSPNTNYSVQQEHQKLAGLPLIQRRVHLEMQFT